MASRSKKCSNFRTKNEPSRFSAWAFEPRFSPTAEMSISNRSPNQALQLGHAQLRPLVDFFEKKIRSSPPNRRTLTVVTKMSKRFAVCNWAQIRSDNRGEHIKRKPLTTPSNLMLTLAVKLIISTKKMTSKKKGGGGHQNLPRVAAMSRGWARRRVRAEAKSECN